MKLSSALRDLTRASSVINGALLLALLNGVILVHPSQLNADEPDDGPVYELPPDSYSPPETRERIVAFAAKRMNRKSVGDGKSTTLVRAALESARADHGILDDPDDLRWGSEVFNTTFVPGYIIQFYNCRFEGGGKRGEMPSRHTAIIEKVKGERVVLLEQGYTAKNKKKSKVRRRELDFSWNLAKADENDPRPPRYVVFAPRAYE